MRFLNWVFSRFDGRRAGRVVIAVAMLLTLPALASPFFIDEYVQAVQWRAALRQGGLAGFARFLNNCFVFAGGTAATNRLAADHDHGAWWTAPDFRVSFWRPLAALTHALDLTLWPGNSVLMHAHSLVWFVALLAGVGALYRRFLAPRTAALALALYAWDDARGMVLSWVANRSALLATLAGVGALVAHDRWRRDGWKPGAWIAPALLAVGLLCGEMALATTGFLFAYALTLDHGPIARRLRTLWAHALVAAAWLAVHSAMGFGPVATGGYVHPLHEPLTFAARSLERAPILALGQLTFLPSDAYGMLPLAARVGLYAAAIAMLATVGWVVRVRLGADPKARFWLVGAGLSLLPICASGPQDRNLVFVGLGASAVIAMLVANLVDDPPTARLPRAVATALVVVNLVLAPVQLPLKSLMLVVLNGLVAPIDATVPRDAMAPGKTLIVVRTAFEPAVYCTMMKRDAADVPRPARVRVLAVSAGDVVVTRVDARTLRLGPADDLFATDTARMFRSASRPFHAGERVELSNTTATVIDVTPDGRPRTVDFRFDAALESADYLWMRGGPHGLTAWSPPRVGESLRVPLVP